MRFIRVSYIVRGQVHKLTLGELTIISVQRHLILGKACSLLWIIHSHWITTDIRQMLTYSLGYYCI